MIERRIRLVDRRGHPYYVRRAQADPYTRPGIWTDVRSMLFDVGLALLFWVGIIAAVWWWLA